MILFSLRDSVSAASLLLLASCVDPESGVGQGPADGGSGVVPPPTDGGADADSGDRVDGTAGAPPAPPSPPRSFFIGEALDYTGNGCQEDDDLNVVTASLRDELLDEGWTGTRLLDSQTKPSDFIDPQRLPFGLDYTAADNVAFAVFAGHGFMDSISWGVPDDTPGVPGLHQCHAFFSSDVRLGSHSGGKAKAVALITSCTGRLACYESSLATNEATQIFAFNDSPDVWGNAAKRFYRKSKRMPNRDAWLKAMDNRPGAGRNSPVVYTRAATAEQALQIHNSARVAAIEETPEVENTSWYAYTWLDHGLHGSCTPFPGNCEGVDE